MSFRKSQKGNVALTFAFLAPVLLGIVGGAIDYARLINRQSELQAAVDAGVLAGGNMLKLAATSLDAVRGSTEQTVRSTAKPVAEKIFRVFIDVPDERTSVFARAEETVNLTFGALLGVRSRVVAAQAKAGLVGNMRLCMLTLDPAAPGAFHLMYSAQVTAKDCSLYSNSNNAAGMLGESSSKANGETICSAGGFRGTRASFTPTPQTDCPAIKDPLENHALPDSNGSCDYLPFPYGRDQNGRTRQINRIITNTQVEINPGIYCYGLIIGGKSQVKMKSGIYIFKNGPLIVTSHATLSGDNVGLFFTGPRGGMLLNVNTTISLTAPVTGIMAGLLLAEERNLSASVDPATEGGEDIVVGASPTPAPLGASQPMRTYRIISNNARTMLGTIYLPAGRLVIDAESAVADQSAYTVVVAQQVNLYKGPKLVLNANYDRTNVPVPKGVGPRSGKVMLMQ